MVGVLHCNPCSTREFVCRQQSLAGRAATMRTRHARGSQGSRNNTLAQQTRAMVFWRLRMTLPAASVPRSDRRGMTSRWRSRAPGSAMAHADHLQAEHAHVLTICAPTHNACHALCSARDADALCKVPRTLAQGAVPSMVQGRDERNEDEASPSVRPHVLWMAAYLLSDVLGMPAWFMVA